LNAFLVAVVGDGAFLHRPNSQEIINPAVGQEETTEPEANGNVESSPPFQIQLNYDGRLDTLLAEFRRK